MKIKAFLAALFISVAAMGISSCVNEAPEIDYSVNYSHVTDFTSLVNALDSQTATIAEKIAAVQSAVTNGVATLEQASKLLKEALVKALNDQNATLAAKMDALQKAIDSQSLTIADKLDLIKTALDNQTTSLEQAINLMKDAVKASIDNQTSTLQAATKALQNALVSAINNQTMTLDQALAVIDGSIEDQTDSFTTSVDALTAEMKLIETAITSGTSTLEQALKAISDAISDPQGAIALQIKAVEEAIKAGNTQSENIVKALGDVKSAIAALDASTALDNITKALADLKAAIVDLDIDNTGIIEAINSIEITVNGGSEGGSEEGGSEEGGSEEGGSEEGGSGSETTPVTVPEDALDLGLSVYWRKMDIGANDGKNKGSHFAYGEVETALTTLGKGWRLPTKDEVIELKTGVFNQSAYSYSYTIGDNTIYFPGSGYHWIEKVEGQNLNSFHIDYNDGIAFTVMSLTESLYVRPVWDPALAAASE